MGTTNLFVELIVIGTGVAIWLVLLALTVFGYAWVRLDKEWMDSSFVAVFGLIMVYVLGILFDRFANSIFKDDTLIGKRLYKLLYGKKRAHRKPPQPFDNFDEYDDTKAIVYSRLESLRDLYEYNRSRLRICRGWALNCVLIIVSLNLFIWTRLPQDYPRTRLSAAASALLLVMAFAAVQGWADLTSNENKNLKLHKTVIETFKDRTGSA
ncbi:MAG TPA: hypothetical protein VNA19_14675 [Pyrinomonadaceae bacterium]|jgi:hypothetical protein|nr:hypothetical protein [Pyrinomonadaceae bacterium]